jgi:hypothetical protein
VSLFSLSSVLHRIADGQIGVCPLTVHMRGI